MQSHTSAAAVLSSLLPGLTQPGWCTRLPLVSTNTANYPKLRKAATVCGHIVVRAGDNACKGVRIPLEQLIRLVVQLFLITPKVCAVTFIFKQYCIRIFPWLVTHWYIHQWAHRMRTYFLNCFRKIPTFIPLLESRMLIWKQIKVVKYYFPAAMVSSSLVTGTNVCIHTPPYSKWLIVVSCVNTTALWDTESPLGHRCSSHFLH